MFVIEDELHAEWQGQYHTRKDAIHELKRRSEIPWDSDPNQAPCMSWRTCGRKYILLQYDDSLTPAKQIERVLALEISASGVIWHLTSDSY